MAFRFSLQPLLRLRASYERAEYLRLLGLAGIITKIRRQIESLDQESRSARARMRLKLAAGMHVGEIQFEAACEKVRNDQSRMLSARLADLIVREEKQRVAYQTARQKREILENLRDRQFAAYRREQARHEQQVLDELYLLHRGTSNSE